MAAFWDGLSIIFILIGSALVMIAAIGIYRLPDTYLRMSAATKASTLGAITVLLAAGLHFREASMMAQVAITILFLLATAPVGAHIIGRAGYRRRRAPLFEGTVQDDLKTYYDSQKETSS